jgi:signal transduction histidine kinase
VYDKFRRAVALTEDEFYTEKSPTYTLSLYPNHDFFEVYHTNNPKIAMIGAVCIILFTSLAFFLYDFFVRREFHAKQELLQAKRQFMRFVSHEVRTPLNSVCMGLAVIQNELAASLGYDSTRLEEIARDDEAAQSLTTTNKESDREKLEWFLLAHEIQANAQGSVDVLNDLLNYDKIEQGTLRLELTPVAIWELIEQAAVEFKLPAARKQLQFDVSFSMNEDDGKEHHLVPFSDLRKLPEEMLKLKLIGDSVRVTQVLRNLISNALKFTPEEGSLRIQASWVKLRAKDAKKALDRKISFKPGEHLTAERRGHVKVTVQDNGAGMSHDQLEKLFSQGLQFNVNELQAGQGSGLGLYIAKGIVDQHEGTLVAASEGLGKGTTFTMTLPLWEFQTTQAGVDVEEGYRISGSFVTEPIVKLSTLRVLIVDDAVTNRKLLARLLANAGHVCDQAENGSIAVDMVEKSMQVNDPYDAVLLDFEMPVMNGPEAVKEIRRMGSDVPVVGITGNILPEDIAFFISCGANAVLPKPLKIAELDNLWMEYGVVGRTRSP